MYRAKAAGGARVVLFDEVTRERALARLHNETAIRRAIEREEFRVFFQPEVSIDGEHIAGLEALSAGSTRSAGCSGLVSSSRCARRPAWIVPLGTWVLRDACQRAVVWQRSARATAADPRGVNVSARQLAQDSLE